MSSAYTISYITTLPYPGTYSKNRKDRKLATLVQSWKQEKYWLIFEENATCLWKSTRVSRVQIILEFLLWAVEARIRREDGKNKITQGTHDSFG